MEQNNKFPTKLFVAAAILNLIILGVVVFYGLAFFSSKESNKGAIETKYFMKENWQEGKDPFITVVPRPEDLISAPSINPNDPSLGDDSATVYLVEYSDFLCDFCKDQEKTLKEIVAAYPDKVRLIWKDYPETDLESLSFKASKAGRCALEQGQFWPYHDLLYNDTDLNEEDLLQYARDLNLKMNVFEECLQDNEIIRDIIDNMDEAQALGISGIPYIFVNDRDIMGEVDFEELKLLVEEALREGENNF